MDQIIKQIISLRNLQIQKYIGVILWITFLGIFSSYLTDKLNIFIHNLLHIYKFSKDYDLIPIKIGEIKIINWIILFLIFHNWIFPKFKEVLLKIISPNKYRFDSTKINNMMTNKRFKKEWFFQGSPIIENGGLIIQNTPSGCLINQNKYRNIWKNFVATIEIEFIPQKNQNINDYLGILFRAQNFDDYFMLEVNKKNNLLEIRPHIRINGDWDAPIEIPDYFIFDFSEFELQIDMILENDELSFFINNDKSTKKIWNIPSHIRPNLISSGSTQNENKPFQIGTSEIYFRHYPGMFGFRNYGNEFAFIKSLFIKGL